MKREHNSTRAENQKHPKPKSNDNKQKKRSGKCSLGARVKQMAVGQQQELLHIVTKPVKVPHPVCKCFKYSALFLHLLQ
jgi:hypothetical protein